MACIEEANKIFDGLFKRYKAQNTEKEKNHLLETAAEDFFLFKQLHNAFDCLEELIKYLIIKGGNDVNCKQLKDLAIRFPSNSGRLLDLYKAFPEVIEQLHDDLFEIINLEDFELMLIFRKIPYTMFYSITGDDSKKITLIRENIEFIHIKSNYLIKKYLKDYLQSLVNAR
jgi:hypothetical protein